ncbi:hypothetical protein HPB51_009928 [Rhipicephalus microplus]|uniref:Uncharacterized protein n=1 Tax=Rhipicephalus microplus TaxID=6941 RepID=A0A9J6ET69_RHIMP|nr:hypothetical protein HPB51_009928 [Rhipicephalus microplus]
MVMTDAVVEDSGNFDHLRFFNVYTNRSTRAYSISASSGNAAAADVDESRFVAALLGFVAVATAYPKYGYGGYGGYGYGLGHGYGLGYGYGGHGYGHGYAVAAPVVKALGHYRSSSYGSDPGPGLATCSSVQKRTTMAASGCTKCPWERGADMYRLARSVVEQLDVQATRGPELFGLAVCAPLVPCSVCLNFGHRYNAGSGGDNSGNTGASGCHRRSSTGDPHNNGCGCCCLSDRVVAGKLPRDEVGPLVEVLEEVRQDDHARVRPEREVGDRGGERMSRHVFCLILACDTGSFRPTRQSLSINPFRRVRPPLTRRPSPLSPRRCPVETIGTSPVLSDLGHGHRTSSETRCGQRCSVSSVASSVPTACDTPKAPSLSLAEPPLPLAVPWPRSLAAALRPVGFRVKREERRCGVYGEGKRKGDNPLSLTVSLTDPLVLTRDAERWPKYIRARRKPLQLTGLLGSTSKTAHKPTMNALLTVLVGSISAASAGFIGGGHGAVPSIGYSSGYGAGYGSSSGFSSTGTGLSVAAAPVAVTRPVAAVPARTSTSYGTTTTTVTTLHGAGAAGHGYGAGLGYGTGGLVYATSSGLGGAGIGFGSGYGVGVAAVPGVVRPAVTVTAAPAVAVARPVSVAAPAVSNSDVGYGDSAFGYGAAGFKLGAVYAPPAGFRGAGLKPGAGYRPSGGFGGAGFKSGADYGAAGLKSEAGYGPTNGLTAGYSSSYGAGVLIYGGATLMIGAGYTPAVGFGGVGVNAAAGYRLSSRAGYGPAVGFRGVGCKTGAGYGVDSGVGFSAGYDQYYNSGFGHGVAALKPGADYEPTTEFKSGAGYGTEGLKSGAGYGPTNGLTSVDG